jgi:hypothetical protein
MTIRFGVDEPESQFESLYQAATGAGRDVGDPGASLGDSAAGLGVSFRADATKVIAITTDASFHTPGDSMCVAPAPCPFGYPGPSQADTITALTAAGIKVIALKAPGSGGEMDALAAATGGSVQTTSSSSDDIAAAILDALEELTFTVTADASGCAPLEVSYDPASHTDVAGGTTVSFEETITVPDGTPGGEYTCTVSFLADDTVIGTQEITILVNTAPSCEDAAASSPLLWPPNHKYVDGSILGITDIDGDELTVAITGITSDEPVDAPGMGDGNTSPDAVIGTGNAFQVRAERQGAGDGRVYLVSFTADDGNGGTCTGTASIGVPHDQGGGATPIDSRGTSYDATTP